jgi:hypothetical protein
MCQIHQIISPLKYLKLGFIVEKILFIVTIVNMSRYTGGKKLLIWRFLFFLSICTGMITGFSSGKTSQVVQMDLFRYFAGFLGICLVIKTLDDFKGIVNLLLITSFLGSFYTITHSGHGPGVLIDENDMASFLVMLLPLPYFISYICKSKVKVILLRLLFLLILVAIASTVSRGGMVGTIPTLLFIWLKSKNKIVTLILVVLAVFATIQFGPGNLISEFHTIGDTQESTASSRMYYWELSYNLFLERPIFGVGANAWGNAIWANIIETPRNVSNATPHSMYFQLISELGGVGLFIFIIIIVTTISISRQCFKNLKFLKLNTNDPFEFEKMKTLEIYLFSCTIGLFGFATCSIFLSTLYYPHFYYYVFFIQVLSNIIVSTVYQKSESLQPT